MYQLYLLYYSTRIGKKAAAVGLSLYHSGSPHLLEGGGLEGWLLHSREDRVAFVVARR